MARWGVSRIVTLIRHGQAGSRIAYDDLSEVGRWQARALGAWFAERGQRFDAVVTGSLTRQRLSAEEMLTSMETAGVARPRVTIDARWDEFDLDKVYAGIGPRLAREDEHSASNTSTCCGTRRIRSRRRIGPGGTAM